MVKALWQQQREQGSCSQEHRTHSNRTPCRPSPPHPLQDCGGGLRTLKLKNTGMDDDGAEQLSRALAFNETMEVGAGRGRWMWMQKKGMRMGLDAPQWLLLLLPLQPSLSFPLRPFLPSPPSNL